MMGVNVKYIFHGSGGGGGGGNEVGQRQVGVILLDWVTFWLI